MNYYIKRIGMAIMVLFVATSFAFVLFRSMPGSMETILRTRLVDQAVQGGGSASQVDQARIDRLVKVYTNVNPNQPMHVAYFNYIKNIILHQDFGQSIWRREPVFDILFEKMPWSIFISVYGLVLGTSVSLLLGAGMAYKEGSRFDSGLTIFTILNQTIPYYIVAIITLILFAYINPIFPTGGRYNPATTPGFNYPFMASVVHHAALPIFSGFIAGFGGALAFRGNCIREMGKGYLRVARLRGINRGRIAIRYVGRNAILPIYTGLMMGIAGIFGSGIILETIFQYPAVGFATFGALQNRDYPLLMGAFIFFTLITVIGILIADFTYGIIDPRVRGGDDRETY
jgi:peptide/nickel transport system permease protein